MPRSTTSAPAGAAGSASPRQQQVDHADRDEEGGRPALVREPEQERAGHQEGPERVVERDVKLDL